MGALRFFSIFSFIPKKKRELHLEENRDKEGEGFIEDQNCLKALPFGSTDMAYAGCEVIAVYNLLKNLGEYTGLNDLIEIFEKRGVVFNAWFGTSPHALYRYFKKNGYDVICSSVKKDYEKIAEESKAFIITFYNDSKDIMKMIHTVCVTRNEEGLLVPHNCHCPKTGFEDISVLERNIGVEGRARIIFIVGVR